MTAVPAPFAPQTRAIRWWLTLIATLIGQLDQPNAVPAQIKVFTLLNGDATTMVTMLEDLFQISGTANTIRARPPRA